MIKVTINCQLCKTDVLKAVTKLPGNSIHKSFLLPSSSFLFFIFYKCKLKNIYCFHTKFQISVAYFCSMIWSFNLLINVRGASRIIICVNDRFRNYNFSRSMLYIGLNIIIIMCRTRNSMIDI